ncbi:MAG: hypothetical protein ACYCUM_08100 [Solirubrobacteraceae bacterium]
MNKTSFLAEKPINRIGFGANTDGVRASSASGAWHASRAGAARERLAQALHEPLAQALHSSRCRRRCTRAAAADAAST